MKSELKKDVIELVAPSFGCAFFPYDKRLDLSIERLKDEYIIHEGKNCRLNVGIVGSNTPIERAKEFMRAYTSDCSIVWSVGGGETMVEILPYIDFAELKKVKPKWFIGYSDNTNLTYTLTTINDIETIYGPCFPAFYTEELDEESEETLNLLHGKKIFKGFSKYQSMKADTHDLSPLHLDSKKVIKAVNYNKPFSGRLIGGCLDCLIGLCGTKFDQTKEYIKRHEEDGVIFFLEACDLNSISYRRALFQLEQNGWFKDHVKGFLIGRPLHLGEDYAGVTFEDVTKDMLSKYNVPILYDCDIGHLKPALPLRSGAKAEVTYSDENFIIKYLD